ncbi:MAG: peptidase M50, partial [Rhodospirillales bacterium]|nr:peptidase M50 [Rhodospirillales bacterium]
MVSVLREELTLHPGPPTANGEPTWTRQDPVRNRFFRISWPAFEMLSRWRLGNAAAIAEAANNDTTLDIRSKDVEDLAAFLISNQLVQSVDEEQTSHLVRMAEARRSGRLRWLLHNYLFFRIPLVRPDRFLSATAHRVTWFGSRWFLISTALALMAGLFLVLRQWELFTATLVDTFTVEGMLAYGVTLVSVKAVHELAHAYTAKNFGCRVPTMGVAFLVMWPMLYTDVNETWKLPRRRQRLAVGAAGILSELAVAAWATLAWTFLPEGPAKQAAFLLAAVTWISSLAINLSPFMRFDGYFLLMDALEIPNLHARSFAVGRWWLREVLFGLGEPPPEPFPPAKHRALAAFAFATWIYRLLLFLGIAVLVYHFFIKVIGVVLFAIEIIWFILLPVWSEIKEWHKRLAAITMTGRTRWTLAAIGAAFLLAFVPWTSRVHAPAVMKGGEVTEVYLPFPAALEEVRVGRGAAVAPGQVLFVFSAPDVSHRLIQARARLEGRKAAQINATFDPKFRDRAMVIREEIAKAEAERAALLAETSRLTLVAAHGGTAFNLLPDLRPGMWLSPRQRLVVVRANGSAVADAYVAEDELERFISGAKATFYPDSFDFAAVSGRVVAIDRSSVKTLRDESLSSIHGGELSSRVSGHDIVPEGAVYRVRILLDALAPAVQLRGEVVIT